MIIVFASQTLAKSFSINLVLWKRQRWSTFSKYYHTCETNGLAEKYVIYDNIKKWKTVEAIPIKI